MNYIKNWIKENWMIVIAIAMMIMLCIMTFIGLSSENTWKWLSKPINELTAGDILVVVLAHAFLNKATKQK